MNAHTRERFIEIRVMRHEKTGLLVAHSKDMRGLIVHGHTFAEINERVPKAIKALLEAEGHQEVMIDPVEPANDHGLGFEELTMKFQLQEAA